ncbi:hypothetical protein MJO28_003593 [Puccinia striiformis f. sp. tritici]|uniref:DUF7872 domain-containing protein n=4 Tax=Puccinia striiformis TaxID=27350 RepID=A0A0L0VI88_9BASI|nr:hypothetical protein Pst134EB_008866 [Puccinia striiformis f. sp. tritici]KNE98946.1 hypothetical protein PSTG_07791 [Puccinia striiformis f. sp. tritici PST-78]POW12267.1 hypothetical protein PSTT_04618 [Puccinia striiformis]KAI7956498.1 hypothetical protein MJO28_003593 [Puccinia striiformis f. sp. tritici]KAI7964307.1 hypothetical protein MJO29_004734 [Puccinia striiformis f. sp. tritici]
MINKLAIVILLYLLGSTFGRPLLSLLPSASLNQTASLNVQHSLSSPPGTNTTSTLNDRLNHDDDCLKRRVSPQLWMDLKMNEYIESYPHGEILSLKQYANRVGANNFNLEIGSVCRVDQLCNGVSGKDWYALVAAQRWSTRLNQAFDAVAFASTIAMEISQAMTFDFVPPPTHALQYASTSISALFWVILAMPGVWFGPIGKYYYRAVLSVFYATTAIIRPLLNLKYPVASHAFTQWSDVGLLLTDVKKNVQGALMNMTMEVNTAGISTATGLRGLNHDGQLFSETIDGAENKMQQEFDQAYKLQTLSHLWKLQNVFITRGSDPCNGNGENGSWSDRGYLSYCTPDGIMMNIVRAKGNKVRTKLFGGEKALMKHGLSIELLTRTAWDCQQKVGRVIEPTSWQNTTEPDIDPLFTQQCMFALPVCDLTRADIRKVRDDGEGTIRACRTVGKIPI